MNNHCAKKYDDIIGVENLLAAWREFSRGKALKRDVQIFAYQLADNILQLHADLATGRYVHGGYTGFSIADPKPRQIHKAAVRDRIVHHAVYRQLYPFFDQTFIFDSYSCRIGKGVHKALNRFRCFARRASRNHTRTVWVLKGDIRKFFATIDHSVLLELLAPSFSDQRIFGLLQNIVCSFRPTEGKGLPLGNLTSQLFCNIYLNKLDHFVKHQLRAQYYIRYADDFVLISDDKPWLTDCILKVGLFLGQRLKMELHPQKISITTVASGVDFLGWVHFPYHRVVRSVTRRRALRRIVVSPTNQTLQSYVGLMSHGNAYGLQQELRNSIGLWNQPDN